MGRGTHVSDVIALLEFEDLTDVHLVLRSYAGVLAGPVAEVAPRRLAAIFYLGAFLASPGECLLDVEPAASADRYRELSPPKATAGCVPASDAVLELWGVTDPVAQAWVGPRRLTDFPLRCQTDPTVFTAGTLALVRQVYLRHTDPPLASLDASYDRAVAAGWERHDIAAGHDVMVAAPQALTDVLVGVASS